MYPVEKPKKRLWPWLLGIGAFAVVLMAVMLFGYNRFDLSVIPEGEEELVLEYGEAYREIGAQPRFRGSRFWTDGFAPEVPLHCEGTVDTEKVGTYTVTYSADFYFWHTQAQRTVHVVDRKPPELRLEGETEVYLLPGQRYEEAGFTATDEYDGELTGKVQRREEEGMVTYSVSDASGNTAEVTRTLHHDDPIPPQIELLGESAAEIYVGTDFTDPGCTAWDNCDGDITERVTVEGTVDRYTKGDYILTYTVTDSYDNTTVAERTVTVAAKPAPERVEPEGKVIYLTFDDGPGPYTRQLLEVLEKYDVKATFFVVGRGYSDVIGEIAAAGHAVGIHSASHDYGEIYASEEAYFADLERIQAIIHEQTGEYTNLLRFPGGSSNTVSCFNDGIMTRLTRIVEDAGFRYFDWNVDSNDAGGAKTADEVYQNVVNGIAGRRAAVVLQHDIKDFSVAAVERIIQWGLANGYTFLPLEVNSPDCEHMVNN